MTHKMTEGLILLVTLPFGRRVCFSLRYGFEFVERPKIVEHLRLPQASIAVASIVKKMRLQFQLGRELSR